MWPKALLEILPHAARLLPMADKFFASKQATDESSKRAMDAMAEGLRGDLGQVTASHAGLYRQLNDISDQLSVITADTAAARGATTSTEARITHLERRLDRMGALLLAVALIALASLGLLLYVALQHRT